MNDPVSVVFVITTLCFFGGLSLALGLHIGWHFASMIVGPIRITSNVTNRVIHVPADE